MTEWMAIVFLGIVEGLTEFLPVSSTGHLLLAQRLFEREQWLPAQSDLFNTVIQCGATLAVLVLFTRRAKQLVFEWRQPETRRFLFKLGAAFFITGMGGVAMKAAGLRLPDTAGPVAWATLVGAIIIFAVERWVKNRTLQPEIGWISVVAVGLAQLVAAAFPGTSRSGATILAAMIAGTSRTAALEFSFLLSIPTLFSAGALQIFVAGYEAHKQGVPMAENWGHLIVAGLVAAITAFLVVRWLLRFVQTHTFVGFAWYRIGLGLALLGLMR